MLLGGGVFAGGWLAIPPPQVLPWVALSGILHGIYILSLSRAYARSDLSYAYPIARSAPVFVPVFAFFLLGERLGGTSLLAIFLVILAVYVLHFKGRVLEGFYNLWQALGHRDLRWSFITLGLVVAYSLVDKQGMALFLILEPDSGLTNGLRFFFLEAILGFGVCNLYLFTVYPAAQIIPIWRRDLWRGLAVGLATAASYGLICVVLQYEPVSQVVAVRQTSVIMVVLWGVVKMKEPFGRERIMASLLMVLGVSLIGLD